jgi:DNA-binding NarL/FixJ family response regulator
VHIHVRHIMDKLGANRRTEAVATALKKGILKVD